ncbi:MAG: hypothetical protein ACREGR_05025 [Minisyncoccia bacterium]
MKTLFYNDSAAVFDTAGLRAAARKEVQTSSLIRRAAGGDRQAALALHIGFWPFVFEFEHAIDRHALPREQLIERFGSTLFRRVFVGLAKAVREMKEEEGSHAQHWKKDAQQLGITDLERPTVPGVAELIASSYTTDHPQFFAALAGTEFIAEELGAYLVPATKYTNLFGRKRWVWGEIHIEPHDEGPSHLEIDLDFARAYKPDADTASIREMVLKIIHLFGRAANDVEAAYAPQPIAA